MKFVVCIKQVPDTKRITGSAMREDGTVNRAALPAVFNPDDRFALEAALSLRDRLGGEVIALTMGLPAATESLRECLMCGADRAILVTDRRAAASDTLATSYILAAAIRTLAPDVVFCGRQAIDGDTAQVGPQIAQKLGFTLATYAERLEPESRGLLKIRRETGVGVETILVPLPALVTFTDTAPRLRPMNVHRIKKYKNAEPEVLNLDDIGAALERCGKAGSPTSVKKIESIVLAGGEFRDFPPTEAGVLALVSALKEEHTL